jgi:hypothetical protein
MTYLLLIIASIALFAGFFGVTVVEARTGTRYFAGVRAKLDKRVARTSFIIKHVDWLEFFTHLVQSFIERVLHDLAHWTLIAVRFLERELTNVVRYLRDRRPNLLAPKPSRTPLFKQVFGYARKTLGLSGSKKSTIEE